MRINNFVGFIYRIDDLIIQLIWNYDKIKNSTFLFETFQWKKGQLDLNELF
jgi:hypothetical protein